MFSFIRDISSEIIIIYGLIIFIVVLIAGIVLLDKKEKQKRIMTRTQELRLMDLRKTEEDYTEEFKKQPLAREEELLDINLENKQVITIDKVDASKEEIPTFETTSAEEIRINEEMYIEDDLEKTSAQIQLELLAKELEKAKETEESKIRKFEKEQEENVIISYRELVKVCDHLYDKNEETQYQDEGNEPINLQELRSRFGQTEEIEKNNYGKQIEVLE